LKVRKAVITAAAPMQRTLPLQTLVDRDGAMKSVLGIIIAEAVSAHIETICIVVYPGDEAAYREAAGDQQADLHFVPQELAGGYGHAVFCARDFTGGEPFLHMVGDHLYVSTGERGCAAQLVAAAEAHACSVSAVQSTRENLLPYFGVVGGRHVAGTSGLYEIERVVEKPTPTEAEQSLLVPGLRAGHYLCFFGMHVLTPAVMEILEAKLRAAQESGARIPLSPVLADLAERERYLAIEAQGRRYPVDGRYGMLTAQLALALSGDDREEVLAGLCELLAQRELGRADR
jgi:UTP--glucose-1-phosphate uridylyltransferase